MVRITLTIARAASGKLVEKALHDQIEENQAVFDLDCGRLEEPTAFRLNHLRPSNRGHSIYLLQPKIKCPESRSLASAEKLYMHFLSDALPTFHTLIHRRRILLPRRASAPRVWAYPEPLPSLTKDQQAHTWEFLGKLAKEIDWDLCDANTPGWKPTTNGWCTMQSDRPLHDGGMLGFGSTITTSHVLVKSLDDAVKAQDEVSQRWYAFRLAVVWLHELSHAVAHAVLPGNGDDDVLLGPNARTSEVGFEVEARMFGGLFQILPQDLPILAGNLAVKQWPDWEIVNDYKQAGTNVETRNAPADTTQGLAVAWKVEWSFIKSMFDEDFWVAGSGASRALQLRPEKQIGAMLCWGAKSVNPSDWLEQRQTLHEEGFVLEESGLVVEIRKRSDSPRL
ncbi:unnamed protein product [Zymoseptoria tritici ST99CH_3D7]|uniref:Uncharacterized protein n=1 Tax=Zymoseptoria tritici (strain ST99CH_3D7) TaxID=1276538 RepID=A0A1X7RHS0_ZYMT9|nr:unnamed protein product [Zymoseptoria tritici ST99CH_3D7]